MNERIAVITDLHANAHALRAAIAAFEAEGVDRWIVLGDLLTYGVDVAETLDTVEALVSRGAALLRGNHDALYLDLAHGETGYYATLPDWIRESVDDTARRLEPGRLARLPWLEELELADVLFAHANPFGDWRYLRNDADFVDAARVLAARRRAHGVFGHVHRHRSFSSAEHGCTVVTVGSLGQPRARGLGPNAVLVLRDGDHVRLEPRSIPYDVPAHVGTLRASGLSGPTVAKLAGFFE